MTKAVWFRPVIFSVNCFIASILTLFIAFSLDLKSPGWAVTTVYLTSQPISGAMRAKAVYRAIGTFVGGVAMVAIVPNLIDAPELTTAAIILWVSLCLFISLLDRTPRSYVFALSGYTAALIGFPSVLAPGTVFDTAVSRVEEITIGVVCAALVHSLIFPKSALSAFEAKLQSALAYARGWIADGLSKHPTPQVEMERRRIAGDITELYLLGTSLRFDTSPIHPDIGTIRAFDRKIVALLPLLSAVEDRLIVLRNMGPLPDKLAHALSDVQDWVQSQVPSGPQRAEELRQACLAATPAIGPQSNWADLITANLTARLTELIDSWQASLDLAAYLANPSLTPSAEIKAAAEQIGEKPLHTDPGIALLSAFAAMLAMGFCTFFWIVTAWPEGANAVAIAAVACTLFAVLDDPTPTIRAFTIVLALCIPIVVVYQFFVLPAIGGFVLLSAALGFVLIPAGILMTIPAYAVVGLALALGFSVEMSLQTSYTADLAQIVNSNSAFVIGALAALITTRLMRVIGVQTSARRLMRATYRDLAAIADGSAHVTRDEWASRMLDRVGLLLFRQLRFEPRPTHEFADALDDLRIGVNIIETRSMGSQVNAERREKMAGMFAGVAAHFRALAHGRVEALSYGLLKEIDAAIGEILACGSATHASVAAIVGLRRTLYPEAAPYAADATRTKP
ncbi:MAG TPA: FUSC family protein [Xanthobacteraceae bacterium]|nr:FUSC family protein [Xanthobacteraceae bacterium]